MLSTHPPRHFCDASVPNRADGTPIISIATEEDYWAYVRWLGDHLFITDLPLHPRQEAWALESDTREPGHGIFTISENASFDLSTLEFVEQAFADGHSWQEKMEECRCRWENDWPSTEDRDEHPLEEYLVDEVVWNRIGEEWMEKPPFHHADIPYRSLLARLLKRIPDRDERGLQLDRFFRNFSETLSK